MSFAFSRLLIHTRLSLKQVGASLKAKAFFSARRWYFPKLVPEGFPRTSDPPSQSILFWVAHKDRYLRQLLIRDIEAVTGRSLLVYFADCGVDDSFIDSNDDVYLAELLNSCIGKPTDLMLETNGGETDATEKICSVLRANSRDLRVIIPRRAKSNGTVVALAGRSIVMGMESELGPIDPSFRGIPAEFIIGAKDKLGPLDVQFAEKAQAQTKKLAFNLLKTGMLSQSTDATITSLIEKIATREYYPSHGSVIDDKEARNLGLNVESLGPDDPLWRQISLLRAMYQHDCSQNRYTKIFEGEKVSVVVEPRPTSPPPAT